VDTPDNVLCRVLDVRHQNTHADRLRFPATPPSVGIVAPGGMQQVAQLSSTQTGPKSTNYHTLPVVCRPPSSGPSIIWKFSSFSTPNGKASPIWPHYVRSLHTHTHMLRLKDKSADNVDRQTKQKVSENKWKWREKGGKVELKASPNLNLNLSSESESESQSNPTRMCVVSYHP